MKNSLINLMLCVTGLISASTASSQEGVFSIEDLFNNAQEIQSQMLESKRTEAFILVSFSMPEQSLNRLAQDAKDAGIPLVFRGVPYTESEENEQLPLLNPKSLSAFTQFSENGIQVELNPEVFSELEIRQVPALVIRTDAPQNPFQNQECQKPSEEKTVIVQGDVTLGYMLDTLLDRKDEAGNKARELRRLLGGRQ